MEASGHFHDPATSTTPIHPGGWTGPTTSLDVLKKKTHFLSLQGIEP